MKLLAISEHYYPRVGGTVNYVHETLCALADLGVEAELVVPGPEPRGWRPDGMAPQPYKLSWLEAGYPERGDPTREQRYDFCRQVNALVAGRVAGADRPDILHVLFGLFVMEVLDTGRLRRAGLPCIATVHNVPPMECRQIAHDAPLPARMREALRLQMVGFKNRARLKKHRYDGYVVPSGQVRDLLAPVIQADVVVIVHGTTTDLQAIMHPPETRRPKGLVRLLTAGGYAPHKRQHIIPETAERLRAAGVEFRWDVVGPSGRVAGYHALVAADAAQRGVADWVHLHESVSFADLGGLYDRANLYVQPSVEEGFCLTALDAAAAGLPVIASRAGALPDIAQASGGALAPSAPQALADAIADFVTQDLWRDAGAQAAQVRQAFSWAKAATQLLTHYRLRTHHTDRTVIEGQQA